MKFTREGFIRKWLGTKFEYTEMFRDLMRRDLDKLIESAQASKKNKLVIPDVSKCPLCGCETTFLDETRCTTIDCPNCIF